MLAIALTATLHLGYDNLWNRAIPPDGEPCEVALPRVAAVLVAIYASEPGMQATVQSLLDLWHAQGLL